MKAVAFALAIVFLVLGALYGLGIVQWFTASGAGHPHHFTHMVLLWVLALLCLIWARFQSAPSR